MHFHYEFIPIVLLNPLGYIVLLLVISFLTFKIAGKFGKGKILFEPFSLMLFLMIVGSTNLLYASLYQNSFDIHYYYPVYFLLLSVVFYRIGSSLGGVYSLTQIQELKILVIESSQAMRFLLYSVFFIYMLFTLYAYHKIGIPLLTEDPLPHHQFFRDLGLINRLLPGIQFLLSLLLIYNLMIIYINKLKRREYLTPVLMMFFLLVTFILSGTKSAILPIILTFGVSIYWFKNLINLPESLYRLQYKVFFIAVVLFLLILMFNFNDVMLGAIKAMIAILFRGDTEVLFFPNMDILVDKLSETPLWTTIFGDPLATVRIISRESLPISLSDQLHNYYYALSGNQVGGPNMRLYFFSIVYFGFFFTTVIFITLSFFIGYLQKSTMIFQSNILGFIYYNILYNTVCMTINDPGLAISFLFSISLSMIIVYILLGAYFLMLNTQKGDKKYNA